MSIKLVLLPPQEDQKNFQNTIDTLHCHMILTKLTMLNLTYEEILQVLKTTQSILSNQSTQAKLGEKYEK